MRFSGETTLSLSPETNPLIFLYELSDVPGVKLEDGPFFLAVTLGLGATETDELVRAFRELPAAMVRGLNLRFNSIELADFIPHSPVDWFQWDAIDELIAAGKLCQVCAGTFNDLHSRFE